MRRGTRVGQAYVSVTADGDGINEAIVDGVDEGGKNIDGKGREHGDKYGDEFSEGFMSRMRNKVGDRLSTVMDGKVIGRRSGDDAGDTFIERMTEKARTAGERVARELDKQISQRDIGGGLADRVGDRIGKRLTENITVARQLDSVQRSTNRMNEAADDAREAAARRMVALHIRALRMNKEFDYGRLMGDGMARQRDGGVGDVIGRMLGKGSRSNILNLFGATMGNVATLTEKSAKFAFGFADGMARAAEGASIVTRLMSGFSGGAGAAGFAGLFTRLIASGPILAAVLGVVLLAASALVSVLGALLAIIIAMSSTIVSALVGALAVVGPLLGAIAVAGGLVVAAFTSMTDAQKKYLSEAFQPVKAAITGVGQIIATQFMKPLYDGQSAIQVWSANIQKAIVPLGAIAQTSARAFADAGNTITAALSGPGFQRFFASLGTYLPGIIRNLSSALGGFLNGITGMFAAIMPYVLQFAQYLDRTARKFSEWANSAKGQNSITDFVGRALTSLKSLWGFIRELGGLISDVLFSKSSQDAGNTIFDGLADALKRVRRSINDGSLKKWFEDAIEFGRKLWKMMGRVKDIFLELYNDGTLKAVGDLMEDLADAFKFTHDYIVPVVKILVEGFADAIEDVMDPIQGLIGMVSGLVDVIGKISGVVSTAIGALRNLAAEKDRAYSNPSSPYLNSDSDSQGSGPDQSTLSYYRLVNNPRMDAMMGKPKPPTLQELIDSGNNALNNTSQSNGGYMPDPVSGNGGKGGTPGKPGTVDGRTDGNPNKNKPPKFEMAQEWVNPYIKWVDKLLARSKNVAGEIKKISVEAYNNLQTAMTEASKLLSQMITESGKSYTDAVTSAAMSTDSSSVIDSFRNLISQTAESAARAVETAAANGASAIASAQSSADAMVSTARGAYEAALANLAAAKNPKQVKAAKAALKQAEEQLFAAQRAGEQLVIAARESADRMIAEAQAAAGQIAAANAIVDAQAVLNASNVQALVSGMRVETATLADYAEARSLVAAKLDAANAQLTAAIATRDNYESAVADSIRSFAALTTAVGRTVDGVQQALTATDITDNMRDRLARIKTFQDNLRVLLAQGLSDAAYKQLVDAGVENGGAFAQALVDGGQGMVTEVNELTDAIDKAASGLGETAATRLYQAGVDAAQGLVDGLLSLSSELDSAAVRLGESIAQAIRHSLGIASPSRVLIADMEHVGDGAVIGLDRQGPKVEAASARLAGRISVSPEVAAYEVQQRASETTDVSGNGTRERPISIDLDIHTPTEDPFAVANEAINQLTGAL